MSRDGVEDACNAAEEVKAPASTVTFSTHADYNGLYRPQVHFSVPQGFMNDPNGMHYDKKRGIYHYYYQLNPSGLEAANQAWGHATSKDLYHWTNHEIAIHPDDATSLIYSGSAVIDSNNTSGFFPDQDDGVVAIYTLHTPEIEDQRIAYSKDGGYTFTKYEGNPVIKSTSANFRDPKVTWHAETQKWVMVIANPWEYTCSFYTSPNLKDWTLASTFSQEGLPGDQFECPNLIRFPVGENETRDVLFISVNPGAVLGGSSTYYLVGKFDGTHFVPDAKKYTWLDFAKDNYAIQFFDGQIGTKPVSISWTSNWDYTNEVPSGPAEGWRGAASLPHEHTLIKENGEWVVTSAPYQGLSAVKDKKLAQTTLRATKGEVSVDFSDVKSNAVYFEVAIDGLPSGNATGIISFSISSSHSGECLDGALRLDNSTFWISRAGARAFTTEDNAKFTGTFNTTFSRGSSGKVNFSAVVDRSVFELFLQDGTQSGTMSFFPKYPLDTVTFKTSNLEKNATVDIAVWGLKSTWTSS